MKKAKIQKLDERTTKALATIAYGDKVKFYDCFEAVVYGDKTFRVMSENPIISTNSKNGYRSVMVKLQGLGLFPIGRLIRVSEDEGFSDLEIRKGLICCTSTPENPRCEECPFYRLGTPGCYQTMDRLTEDLIRRLDNYFGGYTLKMSVRKTTVRKVKNGTNKH